MYRVYCGISLQLAEKTKREVLKFFPPTSQPQKEIFISAHVLSLKMKDEVEIKQGLWGRDPGLKVSL